MSPALDYLIRDAVVFDGVRTEPRRLDVGVQGNRIAHVGERPTVAADREIDGSGLFLCPGFIDTHASTGLGYRFPHAGDNKLFQGVTTEIIGNCGTSPAPVDELLAPTMGRLAGEIGFDFDWRTLREWFDGVTAYGLPFNVGTYIGHSTLRAGTCRDDQDVTSREIERMAALVDEAMSDGALGLSTGLVYAPGSFADTAEIITLAKAAARHGGIYVSHIRDERQNLEESVEETFQIAREAGLPVLISHLKAAERPNWGRLPAVIERIEAARASGLAINFEVYPYTAVSTKLRTFLPKATMSQGVGAMVDTLRTLEWRERSALWLRERGTDFSSMALLTGSALGEAGRSIQEVAAAAGRDAAEVLIDIVIEDPDTWIIYHCISHEDMEAAILWGPSIVCSDSWSYPVNAPRQIGDPHPRTYGAFTRFLERFAITEERLPFGAAVRKITSYPAAWLGLRRRGRIEVGCFADLVLLDASRVRERATYARPRQLSEGTEYVWVNGTLVLERGELGSELPGQILRGSR